MAAPPDKTRVKAGHVSLPLYRHERGWRWAWKDPASGQWRYGTRRDRKAALAAAFEQAQRLASEQSGLEQAIADPQTAVLLQRVLANGLTHRDLDRLANLRESEIHPLGAVVDQFLAAKESARGLSRRNIRTLQTHLYGIRDTLGPDRSLADITPADIEAWINAPHIAPRTRSNRRGAVITLWRWAKTRRLLPADEITAAERTERPLVPRGVPATWTPAELRAMWAVCPASHRPWLALTAWAGVRGEEAYQQDRESGKDVIRWRDLHAGHLEIRPNVAKTGRRRIIPLRPALSAFLAEERARRSHESDDTPVCPGTIPSQVQRGSTESVTAILGAAVGGWKVNALRHSFISYRAVQIGLSRTALEAGNSESEARRSYHDAMTEADAAAWFSHIGTSSELSSDSGDTNIVAIA
jgi:hypothetical protein